MQSDRSTLNTARHLRGSNSGPIRVMIVDDSLTVRTVFSRVVESDPGLQIAGTANSAEQAIDQLSRIDVDVILLDLEMPGMGGLEALPKVLATNKNAQVLVVSSLTEDGAEHTLAALSMGAADTLQKPQSGGFDRDYRETLLEKIKALGQAEFGSTLADRSNAPAKVRGFSKRPEVIAIGASTGGIHALNIILRALPQNFALPILVTQHLPASFMPVFARQLEVPSARRTHIAGDGTPIRPGEILIASGAGHMEVRRGRDGLETVLSTQTSRSGCLPSVDPMLDSLAKASDGHALAVILSGMGNDGVTGAKTLVDKGGEVIAQDAGSSAVWGMPGAVSKADLASALLPPQELANAIVERAGVAAWK